jgi:hypothetical protein
MENVMCRPELHYAATREQYDAFHAGMGQLGLERTIMRNAVAYSLPTGVYVGETADVALLAIRIDALARQITGRPCALVLASVNPSSIHFSGLESPSYADELGVGIISSHHKSILSQII